ncbi:MAG: protease HtpX [Bdellovibrionota bacterium]
MAWAKRIFFFLIVNLAMMVTINLVLALLGVGPYLTRNGLDYTNLAEFCFVWGMGGAFISLLLSKVIAKWTMGVQVVNPDSPGDLGNLVQTVYRLARAANLPRMPEVGVYDSPEVNAFATGPTKGSALVAVSSGLLRTMDRDQIEGVLGHEITHVANGDMVTLTLIQGIVNAFVMFLSRVLAYAASQALESRDSRESGRSNGGIYFIVLIVSQIVFGLIGMMIVAYFSRWREFRADAGGARIAGRAKMIGALQRLRAYSGAVDTAHPSMAAFKINGGGVGSTFMRLSATHPPLDERIRRLEAMQA